MVVPFQFWLTNELHQPPSFLKVIIDVKNMCFEFLEVNVMKFWTYVLQGIDKVLRIGKLNGGLKLFCNQQLKF